MTHPPQQVRTTTGLGHGRKLDGLWIDFVELQRLRRESISDLDIATCGRAAVRPVMFASINGELERIACEAAAVEANDHADMEYKAITLAEYLPANGNALHLALAWSLIEAIKLRRNSS